MRCGDLLREAWVPRPAEAAKLSLRQHIRAWWQACRPPFFITAAIPVTLALALGFRLQGSINAAQWASYALLLAGCFMGLTIANLANDLFDHILGVDGGDNIGGSRVIQSGLISPRQLSIALLLLTPATLAVGGALIMGLAPALRPALWSLSLFAVSSAVFYVAPPLRYGHRALGEVFVCLNMGFIMVGASTTLLLGRFEPCSLALALPVGLMVAGVLYYQSLPEIETDLAAGKHTLANRLGKRQAFLVFRLWWPAVWILLLNLWAAGLAGWPVALCLLGLPFYIIACGRIRAAGQGDWLPLDAHGHLVRKCYLISGAALILGVLL
ncbi:MAG: prenyltransferase [Desulfovibrio sp.]|uniref:prenyltransferase n=1 Tax=Desulfovibrio sp. TaxID=885 RepID=UPI00135DF8C4|nr:prenyltransferase [Desulfovibrio sp.]MTJ91822.1 prenyltransferase [Desulfovibrio sp.]